MEAVKKVLYEITPEELEKVSSGVQVLRYDVLSGSYYVFEKPGIDVKAVVKQRQPELYNIFVLEQFDWTNDLDGILDYLYGVRLRFPQAKDVIKVIEDNCIITRGK